MKDVWTGSLTRPSEKTEGKHPTQKPEYLLERIILASTTENQIILDPFCGSGTTGGALVEPSEDSGIIDEDMHSKGEDGIKLTGGERKVRNMVCNPEEENKNYLEMDGRAIFNFATKTVPKSVSILLERNNLTVDDIKYIVPHQANSRIIEVVAKKLKTTMDKFFIDVDEFGNTSAASIPIALGHMDSKGLLKKGDYIIITGFGGGLTWGSTLIKW